MMFTLAMIGNPHVWKRAQAENDAVVGTGRLPEFDDRPSLPYVDATMREVFRWVPLSPLGACWEANSFLEIFLNIQQAARARLQLVMCIRVTTFQKYILYVYIYHLPAVMSVYQEQPSSSTFGKFTPGR